MPIHYKSLDFMGFPNYRVGADGSVWSRWASKHPPRIGNWKQMKPQKNHKGYRLVRLCHLGAQAMYQVHRLVLLAFVGPCPEGMQARHYPDRTRDNNRLSNLSWATQVVNQGDRLEHGTDIRGEKNVKSKLTNEDVRSVRNLAKTNRYSKRAIGRMFGVSVDCVIDVLTGRTWSHLV